MTQGTLYIVSAPSGAGKSSLIEALLQTQSLDTVARDLGVAQSDDEQQKAQTSAKIAVGGSRPLCNMQVSISHTTRAKRAEEKHWEHYFFISEKDFCQMIDNDAFLEWAKVFGNYYGTAAAVVEQNLSNGIDVFLDIDWQGARNVRLKKPEARSIFILPPSEEELYLRLRQRAQDSEEIIAKRMAQAVSEMSHCVEYDYLIVNDKFDVALSDLRAIICAERLHLNRQKEHYAILIEKLTGKEPRQ